MCSSHQEFRQIVGIKWEDNKMIGLNLKTMISFNSSSILYVALKDLYDEQVKISSDIKLGKRKSSENPINILSCINDEDGEVVGRFVYIVKIGDQYEIRDVKDVDIPQTLEKLPKI